jgi:hypothetical protein
MSANAQDEQSAVVKRNAVIQHHEFFAGTGIAAMPNLSALPRQFVTWLFAGLPGPLESNLRSKPSGAIGYKYRFHKVVSLGATFSYAGNTADSEWIWDKEKKVTHLNRDYYTVAAETEFRWLEREHVTLYSMVGLGAAHKRTVGTTDTGESDTTRETIFTAHLSEIGVKAGGQKFGGYLELGLGYKGVVNLGAYVRF